MARATFRFGEALPAHSPMARFVVSVGAARNDLFFLSRLYVRGEPWSLLARDGTPGENLQLIRLVSSVVYEFRGLLGKGRGYLAIRELLADLEPALLDDLKTVDRLSQSRPMKRIRNATSHYPAPKDADSLLRDALSALVDEEGAIEGDNGAETRASFADDVLVRVIGADERSFREFSKRLLDCVTASMRICDAVIVAYFRSLPTGVVVSEG